MKRFDRRTLLTAALGGCAAAGALGLGAAGAAARPGPSAMKPITPEPETAAGAEAGEGGDGLIHRAQFYIVRRRRWRRRWYWRPRRRIYFVRRRRWRRYWW